MDFRRIEFPVEIRPIRADDGVRLRASHARLSPESRYRRFLAAKPTLTEADARYLVEVDGRDHVALVATAAVDGVDGEIVAVARFVRLPAEPDTAELAIVVADAYQRRGLATELLRDLAAVATEREITRFRATMLADNIAIQRMLERLAVGEVSCRRRGSVTEMQITLPVAAQLAPRGAARPRDAGRGLTSSSCGVDPEPGEAPTRRCAAGSCPDRDCLPARRGAPAWRRGDAATPSGGGSRGSGGPAVTKSAASGP